MNTAPYNSYNIPFFIPDISEAEIAAVAEVMRSGWITTGAKTAEFEGKIAKYCGTEDAICLNSGTAAMECALLMMGIGSGDEVITSAYTYSATFAAIVHVGATPVLVDTAPGSVEMSLDRLAETITDKTKAIMTVDIGGVMCDYQRYFELVKSKSASFNASNETQEHLGRIAIIADAAHSFGSKRMIGDTMIDAGAASDMTAFSFHAVKNLTTSEGGALTFAPTTFNDSTQAMARARAMALHGQTKSAFQKYSNSKDTNKNSSAIKNSDSLPSDPEMDKPNVWEYDIIDFGYKWNMTDINAAIGLAQLSRYPQMLARRHELIENYEEGFAQELSSNRMSMLNHYTTESISSGHLAIFRLLDKNEQERNQIIRKLAEQGIFTNVHFKPLPMFSAYKKIGLDIKDYPNAYAFYANELTLPLHSRLTDEDLAIIIDAVAQMI